MHPLYARFRIQLNDPMIDIQFLGRACATSLNDDDDPAARVTFRRPFLREFFSAAAPTIDRVAALYATIIARRTVRQPKRGSAGCVNASASRCQHRGSHRARPVLSQRTRTDAPMQQQQLSAYLTVSLIRTRILTAGRAGGRWRDEYREGAF